MYLSQLLVDTGQNPDRPRPGRLWLRNIYHVHQRLLMAFPSSERRKVDPLFLQAFARDAFACPRILFRIDDSLHTQGGRAVILVQSDMEPDWAYAFQNAGVLLAAPPQTRIYEPEFAVGQHLRFRVLMNLSKKGKATSNGVSLRKTREATDAHGRPKNQGKRVALTWATDQRPEEAIVPWFEAKAAAAGFEPRQCALVKLGWVLGHRSKGESMRFRSALLEGTLCVSDADLFGGAQRSGLGAAKAFGFGLLSVAFATGPS